MRLLVTGAAGFIGSTYTRQVCAEHEVVVLDKLTYAGRRENLDGLPVELAVGGIEDRELVRETMRGCDAVVNFAAGSHVDRSIADQDAFARTHVIGTSILLDAARELGLGRYLQVSTDEVYGSVESGSFTESSPLQPSSPYSATKAAGDLLVSAHVHTYGIEAVICRGSNNYGPRQYPEKLIPLTILNALHGDPLPVYGDGRQVRNWLHVEDFCRGIHAVLLRGRPGEVYNVGGPDETENIEMVRRIVELTGAEPGLIQHVRDRPGHDRRYSLASDKLRSELGWSAEVRFERGLRETVDWYRDNESWWPPIRSGDYGTTASGSTAAACGRRRELLRTWNQGRAEGAPRHPFRECDRLQGRGPGSRADRGTGASGGACAPNRPIPRPAAPSRQPRAALSCARLAGPSGRPQGGRGRAPGAGRPGARRGGQRPLRPASQLGRAASGRVACARTW